MHPAPADRPFFARVEALRGLGAMAVAGFHFTGAVLHDRLLLQPKTWADAAPEQVALGRVALALIPGHAFLMAFFVISGFVLRVSLGHGPPTAGATAAKFLIARVFRFYPIAAAAVVLSALAGHTGPATAERVVANLLLLDVSMNGHLWALQLELLMVPVILGLFLLERRWGPRVLVAAAAVSTPLAFVPSWAVWPPLSANLFAFVLGLMLPTVGKAWAVGRSRRVAAAWLAGGAAVWFSAGPALGTYSRVTSVIEAYTAAGLLALVAYRPDLPGLRWLDFRPLRALGGAAGSYYVLHMATVPAAVAVAAWAVPAGWSAAYPAAVGVGVIAVWLLALAPPMLLATALVENPGIAAGRRVIRSLNLDAKRERNASREREAGPVRRAA